MLTNAEKIAQWREQNPDEKVTESILLAIIEKSSLNGADLSGADLSHANFTSAEMRDADLTGACLSMTIFLKTDLTGACLRNVDAVYAIFMSASLSEADLSDGNFEHSDFVGANLAKVNLTRARLNHASIHTANLTAADLTEASLSHVKGHWVNFTQACLMRARVSETRFTEPNFTGANMRDVDLGSNTSPSILFRADDFPRLPFNLNEHGALILFPTPAGWKITVGSFTSPLDHLQRIIVRAKMVFDTDNAQENRKELEYNLLRAEGILSACHAHTRIHANDLAMIQRYWNNLDTAQNLSLSTAL